MRALVSAGAGLIGYSVVREPLGKRHEAIVLNDISRGLLLTEGRVALDVVSETTEPLL